MWINSTFAALEPGSRITRHLFDRSTLAFDREGTLIDWESGIWDAYQVLLKAN